MADIDVKEDAEDGDEEMAEAIEEVKVNEEPAAEETEDTKETQDYMDLIHEEAYEGIYGKLHPSFDSLSWSSEGSSWIMQLGAVCWIWKHIEAIIRREV